MYKVPGREFIKSVGQEYQVVKRGKEYNDCAEEYNVELRKVGSNIIFPLKVRLLGRISSAEEGKGDVYYIWGRNQDFKQWDWERISSCWELYPPLWPGPSPATPPVVDPGSR